jgi:long-chain acyl-CoA synthetase
MAVVGRHSQLSYAQLEDSVNRAATALRRLGVNAGDRVAASMPNHPELVVAFLATMRLGAIWAGMNRQLAAPEKEYLLRDIGAKVFIGDARNLAQVTKQVHQLPELEYLIDAEPSAQDNEWNALLADAGPSERTSIEVDPWGPAAISFTSGTTGYPKGAVHSQHNMMVVAWRVLADRPEPSGVLRNGVSLPLTLLNLMILGPIVSLTAGDTLVAVDRVDAEGIAEWVTRERLNRLTFAPTQMHDLVTHPAIDLAAFRPYFQPNVGGADCPPAWKQRFAEEGFVMGVTYGLTEAPTIVTKGPPEDPPGSCGRAWPHLRVEIHDEATDRALPPDVAGEVCVGAVAGGPYAGVYTPMLGYWNKAEESLLALRGGMLHTGDIGLLDDTGLLWLRDRKNDMIVRGGANVYPAEIERVLANDPRVAGSAVVGIADERLGEKAVAAVQLQPGATATAQELLDYCAAQLARYKVPERILFVDELPRTAMGKIRRRDVRPLFK